MSVPDEPHEERSERLLDSLAELIARHGGSSFLAPPVIPGTKAFPETWRPSRGGVHALLRRLAWHAGDTRSILIEDGRLGAPPTERKPATRAQVQRVSATTIAVRVELLGEDDVAGTLAHEIGVAFAATHRPDRDDPYRRSEQPERDVDDTDLERGTIAAVYLGLGVLAANASYQQYTRPGRFNGAYVPHEYDVLQAGYLPMSEIAYLIAVQAAVRGAPLPEGLSPPQRDEASAWLTALTPRADELRSRFALSTVEHTDTARPVPVAFDDVDVSDDPAPRRVAFRWRTHRGGVGFVLGAVLGAGTSLAVAMPSATPWLIVGAAASGHVAGRRVRVPRCSSCATVVAASAPRCSSCGATLSGDIDSLAERLEAEERLTPHDET